VQLTIDKARQLCLDTLAKFHFTDEDAAIVADHLVDAQLTGYDFAGLPRLLAVLGRLRNDPEARPGPVEVVRETPVSAQLDAHGNLGYVACFRAVELAIEKAKANGLAIVGVANAHYSGRSGYYVERAVRAGLAAFHASDACPMVAAPGAVAPVLGSNPMAFGFPSNEGPLVYDLSTASSTWGELQLASRVGRPLPEGAAVDREGNPTTDPDEGLLGALLPWGGHKGFALALAVQLLGIMVGGDPVPDTYGSFGFFFVVWQPELFSPVEEYRAKVDQLFAQIRASGKGSIRLPGERSARERAARLADGKIEVADEVIMAIQEL